MFALAVAHCHSVASRCYQVRLRAFTDGKLFMELIGLDTKVTPAWINQGSMYEDIPAHVTLGIPGNEVNLFDPRYVVEGVWPLRLRKWSRRRESTTYEVMGLHGDAWAPCEASEVFGFRPCGRWHVSL